MNFHLEKLSRSFLLLFFMCMGSLKRFMNGKKKKKKNGINRNYMMVKKDNLYPVYQRQAETGSAQVGEGCSHESIVQPCAFDYWYISITFSVDIYHICEGPSSQFMLFTWCWQVMWRILVFIALYRPQHQCCEIIWKYSNGPSVAWALC